MASLGQKFLRTFRRERARNWLRRQGGDRQLSIVYGPSSPWGKREALRLHRDQSKSEKVRRAGLRVSWLTIVADQLFSTDLAQNTKNFLVKY